MNDIINLLKKDWLKFRWWLLLWVALVVTWNVALFFLQGWNFKQILGGVMIIKMLTVCLMPILVMLIMQADHAFQTTTFWRTRPVQTWQVLCAKAILFSMMFGVLLAAEFVTSACLSNLPLVQHWRKALDTAEAWFYVLAIYVFVASISRNFWIAFGVLVLGMFLFVISDMLSFRLYLYLTGVSIFVVPLAGAICQYLTRRTWFVISGCIVALLLAALWKHAPERGRHGNVNNHWNAISCVAIEGVSVIKEDGGGLLISGKAKMADGRVISPWFVVVFIGENGVRV